MSTAVRLLLLLPVLLLGTLVKRELAKPEIEVQKEFLTRELKSQGKLDDVESASDEQLAASGLPVKSGVKLFVLILATAAAGVVFVFKGLLPLLQDGLATAFVDESHQSGYVKGKMLASQEKYAEAIAVLQKYQKTTPNDQRAVLEIARIQVDELGLLDAAVDTLAVAMQDKETDEDHAAAYGLRIVELMEEHGQGTEKAKHWAELLVQRFPKSTQAGVAANKIQAMEEAAWLAKQNGGN